MSKQSSVMAYLALAVTAMLLVQSAVGQEFVDQFNKRFNTKPPRVGQQMFDGLKAFDGKGKPFNFESLKGKHTVIVFGCLT